MEEAPNQGRVAPFADGYRASGVLLHVTALPSRYGIGDVGPEACRWIDQLAAAHQTWWQILPPGPTGPRNSPYEPLSSFALNPLLISPDWLVDEGWLDARDIPVVEFPADTVDFERVIPFKQNLLDRAFDRCGPETPPELRADFARYCREQAGWLDDFALFVALKEKQGGEAYFRWPPSIALRDHAALERARDELAPACNRVRFTQFLAHRQWRRLRAHAELRNVRLMGDLPIFVSLDSCDAWAHHALFLLDEQRRPQVLSGVPPDYFSPLGQFWGNPLYDWDALRHTGFRWWLDRLRSQLEFLDLIRLDHFRAFEAAWHVPPDAATAREGEWRPGPGEEFFVAVERELGRLPIVAEDLGLITDAVRALRDRFHLPGMRVLQFAFDGDDSNAFLPHNYSPNCVVYTGTHDNNTTRGWFESLDEGQRRQVEDYLRKSTGLTGEIAWDLVHLAWQSRAALAVAPVQDLLGLDASARFNRPGEPDGNWQWRVPSGMLTEELIDRLARLTVEAGRCPTAGASFLT
jgi:4-alpha-glucanotransferase